MGLIHVKAGVEVKDNQGLHSKSGFWYWDAGWDSVYPGDGAAYAATALADAMADLESYQAILEAISVGGAAGLMVSEIRGFGSAAIYAGTDEKHVYGWEKLILQILRQDGGLSHPGIPAPKESCFVSGIPDLMNGADGAVASLTAALTSGGCCDESGNLYKTVVSGYFDGTQNPGKRAGGR